MGRAGRDERALAAGGRVGRRMASPRQWRRCARTRPLRPDALDAPALLRRAASRRGDRRPTPVPISACAIGDSADSLPAFRSASVGPTSVNVDARPLASSTTWTVAPKATVSPSSAGASTTRALRRRSVQPRDPRLEVGLVLLRGVVLGVLLEVAVLAGGRDPLGHRAPPHALEPLELRLEGGEALRRDRFACTHPTRLVDGRRRLAADARRSGGGGRVQRVLARMS